jgi:hypothetical protein
MDSSPLVDLARQLRADAEQVPEREPEGIVLAHVEGARAVAGMRRREDARTRGREDARTRGREDAKTRRCFSANRSGGDAPLGSTQSNASSQRSQRFRGELARPGRCSSPAPSCSSSSRSTAVGIPLAKVLMPLIKSNISYSEFLNTVQSRGCASLSSIQVMRDRIGRESFEHFASLIRSKSDRILRFR